MATAEPTTIATSTATLNAANQAIVADADSRTASTVSTLGLVQQARLSSQNRAVTAAVAAFGKDSTQAAAATQAVSITQAASARLSVLGQKVSTPQPTVASTGWALHGRVYDSSSNPQASYTVFFVDSQKNYLSEYGFAYTDATGYFLINYSGTPAGDAAQSGGSTATGAKSSAAQATSGATSAATGQTASTAASASISTSTAPQLYLQLADANGNPVLLSEMTFTPTTGEATYQVVILPAGATKLGDPPAAVRAVAMPPAAPPAASTTKSQTTSKSQAADTKTTQVTTPKTTKGKSTGSSSGG